jgi:hypothetical protein
MLATRVSVTLKRHSFPSGASGFDQAFLAALQQCGQFLPENSRDHRRDQKLPGRLFWFAPLQPLLAGEPRPRRWGSLRG